MRMRGRLQAVLTAGARSDEIALGASLRRAISWPTATVVMDLPELDRVVHQLFDRLPDLGTKLRGDPPNFFVPHPMAK